MRSHLRVRSEVNSPSGAVVADGRVVRPPPSGVPPSRLGLYAFLTARTQDGRVLKILIERWRREYNPVRPHSALGYRPPGSGGHPPPVREWPVHASSSLIRTASTLGQVTPLAGVALRRRVASSLPACTRSRARGVLVFGDVGPPRRRVCRDRGPLRTCGARARAAAHRRAVSGSHRPEAAS